MTVNLGSTDRILRVLLGIILLTAPFAGSFAIFDSSIATLVAAIVGVILIATSAIRFCPLYRIFGIQTCKL